ncbi:MAG TPA: TatD family deoxyribonuclease [Desulfobacterales bacterium]|nr:TatD family deoxyribonuclease [Desulfobacterales bacterium]
MLIDSHAHLDAPYFRDRLPAVLDRAKKAGVERIITIGVTPSSSRNCIKIAEKYPLVFAAAGYHPHWADGSDSDRLAQAERLAGEPSVVALGEIGLDYHHFHSSKRNQIKLFRHMLEIAVTTRLPVIIHDRKAHVDVHEILCAFQAKLAGGIIHCFSGDWNLAQKYLDWGFYLSVPGPVTYPRSRDLREVAQKAPLEHLLIETDAPHLTPAPRKGRKNEPAFIRYTALEIAVLRKISLEEVADVTSRNVLQAFNLPL